MPPTTIHEAPAEDSFTKLEEHQAQTPSTFYNAKPVLHYQSSFVRAVYSKDQVAKLPVFGPGSNGESQSPSAGLTEVSADSSVNVQYVDIWVSSENLTLFNRSTSIGMSLPYPCISLHAIQRLDDPVSAGQQIQGLYMQLDLSDPYSVSEEDDEQDAIELTLLPAVTSPGTEEEGIKKIFEAVSNCSNLHPDPSFEEDQEMEDGAGDSRIIFEGSVGYEGISGLPGVQRGADNGGLPPPFPGSGGWITAENVGDYFDEEGNWIRGAGADEVLGEGAGRTRTRDEMDGEAVNGNGKEDAEDSKRHKIE